VKRSLAVLAIPLAALGFVACGDDDDEPDSTTASSVGSTLPEATTATSTPGTSGGGTQPGGVTLPSLPGGTLPGGITVPSIPDISVPDAEEIEQRVIDTFMQMGMTEEQAQCLVDKVDLSSGEAPDLSSIMDLLDECDIDISDLNPDG
jgi:hypothetical protein